MRSRTIQRREVTSRFFRGTKYETVDESQVTHDRAETGKIIVRKIRSQRKEGGRRKDDRCLLRDGVDRAR